MVLLTTIIHLLWFSYSQTATVKTCNAAAIFPLVFQMRRQQWCAAEMQWYIAVMQWCTTVFYLNNTVMHLSDVPQWCASVCMVVMHSSDVLQCCTTVMYFSDAVMCCGDAVLYQWCVVVMYHSDCFCLLTSRSLRRLFSFALSGFAQADLNSLQSQEWPWPFGPLPQPPKLRVYRQVPLHSASFMLRTEVETSSAFLTQPIILIFCFVWSVFKIFTF